MKFSGSWFVTVRARARAHTHTHGACSHVRLRFAVSACLWLCAAAVLASVSLFVTARACVYRVLQGRARTRGLEEEEGETADRDS